MPHVIWFECLKILTHKKLCNLYEVERLMEMCNFFLAFENIERLQYHIKKITLKQSVNLRRHFFKVQSVTLGV
jgi:hypothetical protein